MPTVLVSRSHTPEARLSLDVAPLVVVAFLTILFALAAWAALSPHPLPPDPVAAAFQGGL